MKNFSQYIKETYLKGNPGIPGENGDPSEPKYLDNINRRVSGEIRQQGYTVDAQHAMGSRAMGDFMRYVMECAEICAPHRQELADLAKEVVYNNYGEILDGWDLDIDITDPRNINFRDMNEGASNENMSHRDKHIYKRKLTNIISQGEGLNAKYILNLPECIEGLTKIYGEDEVDHVLEVFNRLSRLASVKDWAVSTNFWEDMIRQNPNANAGGRVKVRWNKDNDTNESLILEDGNNFGKIEVKAADFPMALHEAIKGIYEAIAANGIPDDPELAKAIRRSVDQLHEEPEEWRYGPYIAGDLRDFVNENKLTNEYPNLREFVFGVLVQMEPDEFFQTMKGILMKTPSARKKIDNIINDIVSDLEQYNKSTIDNTYSDYESDDDYDDNDNDNDSETPEDEELSRLQNQQSDETEGGYENMNDDELLDALLDAQKNKNTLAVREINAELARRHN